MQFDNVANNDQGRWFYRRGFNALSKISQSGGVNPLIEPSLPVYPHYCYDPPYFRENRVICPGVFEDQPKHFSPLKAGQIPGMRDFQGEYQVPP